MLTKIKKQLSNKIAYIINDESITYGELWSAASEKAALLNKQGNSPVIIYGHKDINMIISILACLIAKRAYVPIEEGTPITRIEQIIKATSSTLLIKNEDIEISDIENCTLDELIKFKNENLKESENNIAYIIFTSGSTGEPKGVPISKANLENFINWISKLKPLSEYEDATVLNQASFSFDLSVADIYYSLCNGHTLVGLDKQSQENYNDIFKGIKNNKINIAVMTPTFIKLCLLNEEFNYKNYPFLKCIYFCGEQLEVKTVTKIFAVFPEIKIINAYGPTEATSAISASVITKEMLEYEILPVGDMDKLATEVIIEDEEIVIKGKSVFAGYLGGTQGGYFKESATNCYRTGDIGYIENNKLYCKGRKDNQIKYKGYRIELNDIEMNMKKIEGVKEAIVVAKSDSNGIIKMIKSYVVLEKGYEEEFIRKELKKLLPSYMVPKVIKKLDKMPINKNGKIDRRSLSELW